MHDEDDEIAGALRRLHARGWSVGDAVCSDPGGIRNIITGSTVRAGFGPGVQRAPKHGGIRLTGPRRSGYFRGGLDRLRRHFQLSGQVPPRPDHFCATTSRSVRCNLV